MTTFTEINDQKLNEALKDFEETKEKFEDIVRAHKVARLVIRLKQIALFMIIATIAEIVVMAMFSTWMAQFVNMFGK